MQGLGWTSIFLVVLVLTDLNLEASGTRSYYDVLEVGNRASDYQIKKAFRKLALQYHPDKNSGAEAAAKFEEITKAYNFLTDKERRQLYDRYGGHQGERSGGIFANDVFSSFSRAGRSGVGDEEENRIPRGSDVIVDLPASLEDLYLGRTHTIWREKTVVKTAPGKRECNCENKLFLRKIRYGILEKYSQVVCEECPNLTFAQDGGFVTVDVEKGMREGDAITFYEDGDPVFDGKPGDLKFIIRTYPHKRFEREGDHLHTSVTISVLDASQGFERELTHLDGHKVSIGTKGVTKPGEVKRFEREGMPVYESTEIGDLFVSFQVAFPDS